MEAAVIPPIPHLDEGRGRKYHLILAHQVESSQDYESFFKRESDEGSFIILDNSAHENNHGQPIQNLLKLAEKVGASEIVIPDKLFDCVRTAANAYASFEYLMGYMNDYHSPYRWMMVPQGNDIVEWEACFNELLKVIENTQKAWPTLASKGFTIGLSKDFEVWDGGLYRILEEHIIPGRKRLGYDIHLLGWGRDLWALRGINQDFGNEIRSIDSAKPFVYGINNIKLDPYTHRIPPYPKRPKDYFQYQMGEGQLESSRSNIRVFENLAHSGTFD